MSEFTLDPWNHSPYPMRVPLGVHEMTCDSDRGVMQS
jgi:hypothetical protein